MRYPPGSTRGAPGDLAMTASRTVFVAGASGAIGLPLCRLLVEAGWRVTRSTRSPEKATWLERLGVTPVVVDAFDAARLRDAVAGAMPAVVIHQLTDLPDGLDPARMAEARVRNARLREIGTGNLLAAARAAGALRFVAHSIAFAYAPGPQPYREDAPLDTPDGDAGISARGVIHLEQQVLGAPLHGIVLRYGKLYGPGTGFDAPPSGGPVHVHAAAHAALLATLRGDSGCYNIAENDGTLATDKARRELGWNAGFRMAGD